MNNSGQISDGFHTFDDLYAHRNALFLLLMSEYSAMSWQALAHDDGSMFPERFIAGIDLPNGPITYHLPIANWGDCADRVRILDRAPPWDGHTPEDVVQRLHTYLHNRNE